MFFRFDRETNGIIVPSPFNRIMTPIMTAEMIDHPIAFSIHMTEWPSGAEVDEHAHPDATEVMYCLSGYGIASVDGIEYDFVPDSMISAFPGQSHRIRNTGTENLKVLCIFSPPVTGEELRFRAKKAVDDYLGDRRRDDNQIT